jgi:deoxyribonuclease-4
MSYIGMHIDSDIDKLIDGAKYAKSLKCNLVQIFLKAYSKKADTYNEFGKFLKDNNMRCVIHASYTINLSSNWDPSSVWITQFVTQIELAYELNALYIVVHVGKQMELTKEEAYNNMYMSLIHVHNKTKKTPVKILIETSTGQGSEICFTLVELAYFFKKLSHHRNKEIADRFGICVDSCHIFAAGYDIRDKISISRYLDTFEELIGLRHIGLIHLNDSKKELGSNVDRHESLGNGMIGEKGLKIFAKFFIKLKVPVVLETSSEFHDYEVKNYLLI